MESETKKALYLESASKELFFYLISQKTVVTSSFLPQASRQEQPLAEAAPSRTFAPQTYLP